MHEDYSHARIPHFFGHSSTIDPGSWYRAGGARAHLVCFSLLIYLRVGRRPLCEISCFAASLSLAKLIVCRRPLPIDVCTRTRTHHARSCRTSGRTRGLITRTHPTLHQALEHDRPRIRFSCVSRWQCPVAFCFVSHLVHITCIPFHDISHT